MTTATAFALPETPDQATFAFLLTVEDGEQGPVFTQQTTPALREGQDFLNPEVLFQQAGIAPVTGTYSFRYALGSALQVEDMPTEVGETGRRQLIDILTPEIRQQTMGLAQLYESLPTDEQIAEAAGFIARDVFKGAFINPDDVLNPPTELPDAASVQVTGVCGGCMGAVDRLTKGGFTSLFDVIDTVLPSLMNTYQIGESNAQWQTRTDQSGNTQVTVGFATCACPYADDINTALAQKVQTAIGEVARDQAVQAAALMSLAQDRVTGYGDLLTSDYDIGADELEAAKANFLAQATEGQQAQAAAQ